MYLGIILTKQVKDLYNENDKTLKERLRKHQKMERPPILWIGRIKL